MTGTQFISNIFTKARSVTRQFTQAIEEGADLSLIGQFCAVFLAFLASDRVVVTPKNDDDQYIWKSEADKNFTIKKDESYDNLICRIKVITYLKENLGEFLEF
jgi:molecular chaperone HtpG